jgi:hypothetical protein
LQTTLAPILHQPGAVGNSQPFFAPLSKLGVRSGAKMGLAQFLTPKSAELPQQRVPASDMIDFVPSVVAINHENVRCEWILHTL